MIIKWIIKFQGFLVIMFFFFYMYLGVCFNYSV